MTPVWLFFVAFSQLTTAYRSNQQAIDVRSNQRDYFKFDNFDDTKRPNRQLPPSSGFEWDSPDEPFQRPTNSDRSNEFQWDSNSEGDTFLFEDDFESRLKDFGHTTPRPFNHRRKQTTRRKPTTQRIPTSTAAIPGMETPRSACENRCMITPEYNPVCGDDNMTYFSMRRLVCAQKCGKRVNMKHSGACSYHAPRG